MKKYLKYFLYGIIYLILIFVFAVMFIVTAPADVIKPNNGIEPYQVVKIQLRGLKNNDDPFSKPITHLICCYSLFFLCFFGLVQFSPRLKQSAEFTGSS